MYERLRSNEQIIADAHEYTKRPWPKRMTIGYAEFLRVCREAGMQESDLNRLRLTLHATVIVTAIRELCHNDGVDITWEFMLKGRRERRRFFVPAHLYLELLEVS